jgi:hypothetical protein
MMEKTAVKTMVIEGFFLMLALRQKAVLDSKLLFLQMR